MRKIAIMDKDRETVLYFLSVSADEYRRLEDLGYIYGAGQPIDDKDEFDGFNAGAVSLGTIVSFLTSMPTHSRR